jgi:hypothetical protein
LLFLISIGCEDWKSFNDGGGYDGNGGGGLVGTVIGWQLFTNGKDSVVLLPLILLA